MTDTTEHPATCGGTYNGIGFIDPEQQRHRARCTNHGLRLVETRVRHGPYYYVAEPDPAHTQEECDGTEPHTHAGMTLPPSCPCEPPCEDPEECEFPWK